ncbi:hypothetical protein PtB15_2B692 [Puccinia triticina]|nr:hypothetical protein PtB15_2B692 [Puccinia triticina]
MQTASSEYHQHPRVTITQRGPPSRSHASHTITRRAKTKNLWRPWLLQHPWSFRILKNYFKVHSSARSHSPGPHQSRLLQLSLPHTPLISATPELNLTHHPGIKHQPKNSPCSPTYEQPRQVTVKRFTFRKVGSTPSFCVDFDLLDLSSPALAQWRGSSQNNNLSEPSLLTKKTVTRLLESDNPADYTLLCFSLSSIFSTSLFLLPATISHAQILLYGQLQRLHRLASDAAGVGSRSTVNGNGLNPGWDDHNLYMSYPTIKTLSNTSQSTSARERSISPGDNLIKTLVPFLTSKQPPFREATIWAMSSIHVSMYPTLLEGLSGLAHHLTSERKMIEAQKDRSARPNGTVKIIRLFSAIGKLHESTTKLLSHHDYRIADRTIDILSTFSRETCIFLKSQQNLNDLVSLSICKSFLIFAKRLLRKAAISRPLSSATVDHTHLFPNELFLDFYNLAEDWSTRAINSSESTADFELD